MPVTATFAGGGSQVNQVGRYIAPLSHFGRRMEGALRRTKKLAILCEPESPTSHRSSSLHNRKSAKKIRTHRYEQDAGLAGQGANGPISPPSSASELVAWTTRTGAYLSLAPLPSVSLSRLPPASGPAQAVGCLPDRSSVSLQRTIVSGHGAAVKDSSSRPLSMVGRGVRETWWLRRPVGEKKIQRPSPLAIFPPHQRGRRPGLCPTRARGRHWYLLQVAVVSSGTCAMS